MSDSAVLKKTREPSIDAASKKAFGDPLPPLGPIDICVVMEPVRSYTSLAESVSPLTRFSSVVKKTVAPSGVFPPHVASTSSFVLAGPVEMRFVLPLNRS